MISTSTEYDFLSLSTDSSEDETQIEYNLPVNKESLKNQIKVLKNEVKRAQDAGKSHEIRSNKLHVNLNEMRKSFIANQNNLKALNQEHSNLKEDFKNLLAKNLEYEKKLEQQIFSTKMAEQLHENEVKLLKEQLNDANKRNDTLNTELTKSKKDFVEIIDNLKKHNSRPAEYESVFQILDKLKSNDSNSGEYDRFERFKKETFGHLSSEEYEYFVENFQDVIKSLYCMNQSQKKVIGDDFKKINELEQTLKDKNRQIERLNKDLSNAKIANDQFSIEIEKKNVYINDIYETNEKYKSKLNKYILLETYEYEELIKEFDKNIILCFDNMRKLIEKISGTAIKNVVNYGHLDKSQLHEIILTPNYLKQKNKELKWMINEIQSYKTIYNMNNSDNYK